MKTKPDDKVLELKKEVQESKATSKTDKKAEIKKSFTYKWENHRYLAVRASYQFFNAIWTVVMAIGMFLAWLIAVLAT
ncbi:hypothetical protein LX97_02987 [Nonlabens dokdonensis]|jgi:hypothetical protein|uniref:Uncharacterized protein n=2 Tax=Nonlabens dokdonensis TaxID=328515 RepID=L7WD85_NONDD|nr:hypothetical protein [Nonlabens dokdonensis]AGC78217.1 hypothetical protein DDD_3090 [Nonlabens dokdonensis DSW-6]PZX37892.1 hypothetical protein LX97_02987 [Nonlabens dokdonensis]